MITGGTGAGKTTFGRKLEKEKKALLYSIDNWMQDLYWQDMPEAPDMKWFVDNQKWYTDRIQRCEKLILKLALQRAKISQASIIDLGFTFREHRKKCINYFVENNIPVTNYFLDIAPEVRWSRVEKRNSEASGTYVMQVDRSMFDYMEGIFERPSDNEGADFILLEE